MLESLSLVKTREQKRTDSACGVWEKIRKEYLNQLHK